MRENTSSPPVAGLCIYCLFTRLCQCTLKPAFAWRVVAVWLLVFESTQQPDTSSCVRGELHIFVKTCSCLSVGGPSFCASGIGAAPLSVHSLSLALSLSLAHSRTPGLMEWLPYLCARSLARSCLRQYRLSDSFICAREWPLYLFTHSLILSLTRTHAPALTMPHRR